MFCISGKPAGNASELAKHKPARLARGLISGRFLLTHSRTHSHHYCTSAGLQLQGACTLCQYRDIHALFTAELR